MRDPQVWIPLLIAAIASVALVVGEWWSQWNEIKRLPPGSFIDWHDD